MPYSMTLFQEDNMAEMSRNTQIIMGKAKMCQRIRRETGSKAIYWRGAPKIIFYFIYLSQVSQKQTKVLCIGSLLTCASASSNILYLSFILFYLDIYIFFP